MNLHAKVEIYFFMANCLVAEVSVAAAVFNGQIIYGQQCFFLPLNCLISIRLLTKYYIQKAIDLGNSIATRTKTTPLSLTG